MASDSFAAILQQSNGVLSLTDPYSNFVSITPSDTVTFSITRGVYVANSGTLVVDGGYGGVSVTFTGAVAGTIYPLRVSRVYAASSSSIGLVGLY